MNLSRLWRKRRNSGRKKKRGTRRDARPRSVSKAEKQVGIPVLRPPPSMVKVGAVHTESVFPLATFNYKISANLGVTTIISTPLRAILVTGAGPNLIREEVFPEDWSRYRAADVPFYKIVSAGGKQLRQKGVITLFMQVGNLRAQARLIVVYRPVRRLGSKRTPTPSMSRPNQRTLRAKSTHLPGCKRKLYWRQIEEHFHQIREATRRLAK
jgi:hypothetical protein